MVEHSQSTSTQPTEVPTVRIQPVKGLVSLNLHEIWEYRELLWFLFTRDVKSRYRQMAFGPLWIVMAPILNVILFSIIFGRVAKLPSDGIPYPLFSYSAILPWSFFSGSLFASADSLLSYRSLISKIYFPRLVIPLAGMLSAFLDFLISFVILLAMTLWYGYTLSWHLLMLPVCLLLAALTGLAVGIWAATWIVHFRDVSTILGYVVRIWLYASPVVYAASLVPEKLQPFYRLNPMTNMIEWFRWALLGEGTPSKAMLALSFALVIPLLVAGAYYFRRTERNIVDVA